MGLSWSMSYSLKNICCFKGNIYGSQQVCITQLSLNRQFKDISLKPLLTKKGRVRQDDCQKPIFSSKFYNIAPPSTVC